MDLIKAFTNEQLKAEVPSFSIGDTVRVENKIKEGNRERIQIYEGTVIARHGGGISETFYGSPRHVWLRCGKDLPPAFPERCGHYRHSRR